MAKSVGIEKSVCATGQSLFQAQVMQGQLVEWCKSANSSGERAKGAVLNVYNHCSMQKLLYVKLFLSKDLLLSPQCSGMRCSKGIATTALKIMLVIFSE